MSWLLYLRNIFNWLFYGLYQRLFLQQIWLVMLICEFFMLFFTLVSNWLPLEISFQKSLIDVSLSGAFQRFLVIDVRRYEYEFKMSSFSLIKCSLNPKIHLLKHFPRVLNPSKVSCIVFADYSRPEAGRIH